MLRMVCDDSLVRRGVRLFSFVFVVFAALGCVTGWAQQENELLESVKKDPLESLHDDVEYLVQNVTGDVAPDPAKFEDLLAFVTGVGGEGALDNDGDEKLWKLDKAYGAHLEFDLATPLSRLMEYAFNPDLPVYLTYPQLARLGGWKDAGRVRQGLADMRQALPGADQTMWVRGVEYEETMPDETAGVYYRYDMNRLIILLNYEGRDVLVSVSRLAGDSTVGKKGLRVGPEKDWTFFFSGITGVMMDGLGWAESYIYDSTSIYIYFSPEHGANTTRVAMLKWVYAGWAGMNMAGREDIAKGLQAYKDIVTRVLTQASLPPSAEIAAKYQEIRSLPDEAKREELAFLNSNLEESAKTEERLQAEEFQPLVGNGTYLQSLTGEELECEAVRRYIRTLVP